MARTATAGPLTPHPSTAGTLAYVLLGLLAWAAQFGLLYAAHALLCRFAVQEIVFDGVVLAVTAVAGIGVAAFLVWQRQCAVLLGLPAEASGRRTYDSLARLDALLSLVAILWTGAAGIVLTACAQGR